MSRHARSRPRRRTLALGAAALATVATMIAVTVIGGGGSPATSARDIGSGPAAQAAAPVESRTAHGPDQAARLRAPSTWKQASPLTDRAERATPTVQRGTRTVSRKLADRVERRARLPKPVPVERDYGFRIGTYNILGSQHKRNGVGRAATSAGLIIDRGIDVVGLQEVQRDQLAELNRRMPGYQIWPQGELGRQGYRHQIAYRTSRFEMVSGDSVSYTFSSQRIPLPYIRLRDKATGGEFYVIDTHNSAGSEAQRDAATGIEISLINDLKQSGLPVFIVGDMNEHTEFFCRVAQATGMVAANGGGYSGGCQLPPRPLRVDWIMGVGGVDFSGYVQDGASRSTGASDHYFLYADVATRTESPPTGGTS